MATTTNARNGSMIVVTIILSMVLVLIPLPEWLRLARPEWVLMTLIYWAMALPHRVNIGGAWFVGLLMDAMLGSALGVLAFSYALSIYLIAQFHLQLRQYPLWQQALAILSVVFMVNLIYALFSDMNFDWRVSLPALTSTVFWPFMYAFLRNIRRTFQVS